MNDINHISGFVAGIIGVFLAYRWVKFTMEISEGNPDQLMGAGLMAVSLPVAAYGVGYALSNAIVKR